VLGVSPILLVIALLRKTKSTLAQKLNFFIDIHWTWAFSIYIAFALIGWIQILMLMLHAVSWLHTFYVFLAVAIIFVALLPQVRNQFKK